MATAGALSWFFDGLVATPLPPPPGSKNGKFKGEIALQARRQARAPFPRPAPSSTHLG